MLTGLDPIIAELMRQERLQEAERHRLYRQLPRSRSPVHEIVAALLRRVTSRIAATHPSAEAVVPSRKLSG
jgi:hypothetical protein